MSPNAPSAREERKTRSLKGWHITRATVGGEGRSRAGGEELIPTYKQPSPVTIDTRIPREDFRNSFSRPPCQSRHFTTEPSPGLPEQGRTPSTKPGAAQGGGKPFQMSDPSTDTKTGHPTCPGSSLPPSSADVTPQLLPARLCSCGTRTRSPQRALSERCEQGTAPASPPLPLPGCSGASGRRGKASGSPG